MKKGTTSSLSGRFDPFNEAGVYVCRRCGWPSFDAEIPGAVRHRPDADGRRTEIMCAHCGAHRGRVVTGERMTPSDTRHGVNSISMDFVPRAEVSNHFMRAVFAGGCFWGVEYFLQQATGVVQTGDGDIGGTTQQPTYE